MKSPKRRYAAYWKIMGLRLIAACIVHFSMTNLNMHSIGLGPAVSIGPKFINGGQLAFMEIILC